MKETIKKLIREFHSREIIELVERDIEIPLKSKKIVSLIGPRRSGKTFLLYQLISKIEDRTNVLYINFEDERLDLEVKDLDQIIQAYFELYPEKKERNLFLFFDEIQEVDGWEKFVRRIYDNITKNIFLTGSSSKLLSKEIATSLRGRTISYEVFPLSFREYLKFKKVDTDFYTPKGRGKIFREFNSFLREGGFPETVGMVGEIRRKTLNDYLDVMIYRDIIERYDVKNSGVLDYLIKKILTNPAQETSINKIYNEIKSKGLRVSKDLLYEYSKYIEDAFLVLSVKNYSGSFTKQNIKKFYPIDTGLSTNNLISLSEEYGKLLETISYLQLRRDEKELYYFKETTECDFLIKEKNKIVQAIQVTDSLRNKSTRKREIRGLVGAMDKFNLKEGLILTSDTEEGLTIGNRKIKIMPVWKWLLS